MKKHLYVWACIGIMLSVLVSGCGGSDEQDQDTTDGDTQDECTSNADCPPTSTNWTCNVAAGICIDQGTCQSDADCELWYGEARACNNVGLCIGAIADGDVTDGDGTDGDGTDGDQTDGDSTDGDLTCGRDFSGAYSAEVVCGNTQNLEAYVIVDNLECGIQIRYEGALLSGQVNDDQITLDSGKTCSGEYNAVSSTITLECEDGCTITLTPRSLDDSDAELDYQPPELRFGSVAPGEAPVLELVLFNLGTGDLEIADMFFTADTPNWYSVDNADEWTMPTTIASGEDGVVAVKFEPTLAEATTGTLVVLSNARNMPVAKIKLQSDKKVFPVVELDPTVLNFGSAPPGMENNKFFLIKSVGGAPANVLRIEMVDDADGAFTFGDWATENADAQPPFTLESSFSKPVYIHYRPIDGVHAYNTTLTGSARVIWVDKDDQESELYLDLIGKVNELQPACLDIQPLGGKVGFAGLGEVPGPGIKFGNVEIGTMVNDPPVQMCNCGDQPLTITDMVWQNPMLDSPLLEPRGFWEVPGSFHNYTLQRGECVYIEITFAPAREGALYASAFLFMTNASRVAWAPADAPPPDPTLPITVGVSGIGARRGIAILPSKLEFGPVTIDCCSRPQEVSIYNVGDLPLDVSDIKIGAGSDSCFIIENEPQLPIVLGGEGNPQSFDIDVKFCAEREGPAVGRIEVTSNDENNSQFIVPLSAEGTTLTHWKDTFTQTSEPSVDVLWVIDCSGSMQEERHKVQEQAARFVGDAVAWDASIQLGVVSCDVTENNANRGVLQGSPKYLQNETMSSQSIINGFKDRVNNISGCAGEESGLEAAHLALSEPIITNENAGFLRDEAKLAIIFVSDEEDQSVSDVPFFIDFFRSIKGMRNVNMIEVYAIVGDKSSGCNATDGSGDAGAGKRYIAVADACNVHDDIHFYSICSTDYEPVFESLGDHLFVLRNQFFLSMLADADSIVVTVDGHVDTDWEYDEVTNSVIFPEDNPPGPGAVIEIEYDTLCIGWEPGDDQRCNQ